MARRSVVPRAPRLPKPPPGPRLPKILSPPSPDPAALGKRLLARAGAEALGAARGNRFDVDTSGVDEPAASAPRHAGRHADRRSAVSSGTATFLRVRTLGDSEITVRAGEDGEWIATEAQDDGSDAVMVLDENLDRNLSGRVVRGDPDTN